MAYKTDPTLSTSSQAALRRELNSIKKEQFPWMRETLRFTGEIITGPKAHKTLLHRLKRLSRGLSRKVKGALNRNKAKQKLAKLHAIFCNIRSKYYPFRSASRPVLSATQFTIVTSMQRLI